ncbi:unnamed protein product [Linum tenue]|uniref:Transmembrane protein n=1 Tax=Linum tenue TaxID=586396 RepID=A0AAV0LLN9_9ROSI|nr:unnamed protein product [Linum tenue]
MARSLPGFLALIVAVALICCSFAAAASTFQPISESHRSAALETFDRSYGRFVFRTSVMDLLSCLLKGIVSTLQTAVGSASSLLEFYHSIGGLVLVKVSSVQQWFPFGMLLCYGAFPCFLLSALDLKLVACI